MAPSFEPSPSSRAQFYEALSRGRRLTQRRASKLLDVSPRQVRNLVKELRDRGVPVQADFTDRERIYYLKPKDWYAETVSLDLTEQQLMALLVATQAARPTLAPTPLLDALNEASDTLEKELEPRVDTFIPSFESERWHFSRAVSSDLDPDIFWALKSAIADCHPVLVDYYSAYREAWSRDRKINPLLFAVRKGAWLCVAYCHERATCLDFNLVDIKSVTVCENERYTPPSNFDQSQYFEGRFGALEGDSLSKVILRVESRLARYFKRKQYHPTQTIDEGSEGIQVTFQVRGLEEIASFVRSWGSGVEVIEPPELAERIVADAQAVINTYTKSRS
jgi:predicted DNA-binding transcriptional regulator YafY